MEPSNKQEKKKRRRRKKKKMNMQRRGARAGQLGEDERTGEACAWRRMEK
jgi:hypothetical protein